MSERMSPPVIRGESMISVLGEQNKSHRLNLLFTGRDKPYPELEARFATWRKGKTLYADCETQVICAAKEAIVPVFMALVPRTGLSYSYNRNDDNGINFYIDPLLSERFRFAKGYVAVVKDDGFEAFDGRMPQSWPGEPTDRLPEMRRTSNVVPLFNVEVGSKDFFELLEAQPASKLLPYEHA